MAQENTVYMDEGNGDAMKNSLFNSLFQRPVILGVLSCFILFGCLSSAKEFFEPGIYEGAGDGYRGIIRLQVHLSKGGIEDIEILESSEDSYAMEALEELLELALEMNSADLDAVSGATVSSMGFLSALEEALAKGANAK